MWIKEYWHGLKNQTPGASIFWCRSGKCLFEMKIRQIFVYACLMSKPIFKKSSWVPILIICNAKLPVSVSYTQSRDCIYAYATLQYPCVLDIPLTFLPVFIGKACLDTQIRCLHPEFYNLVIKFWIFFLRKPAYSFKPSDSLHWAFRFVAFGNCMCSRAYGITLICLHFIHITHTTWNLSFRQHTPI